jgi:hypothetical protein
MKTPLNETEADDAGQKKPQKDAVSRAIDQAGTTKKKIADRLCRIVSYYVLLYTIQLFCAVVVVAIVIWAAIQFMRLWSVLGVVSSEPPGLTYLIDYLDPPPPPAL